MTAKKDPKDKKKVGRKSKYDPDYHPERAVELMKAGKHMISVAADFDISKATLFEWIEVHPEFSDSIKRGKVHLEAFFYEKFLAMGAMPSNLCNVTAMIFLTKNAIGWSDKVEHQINPEKITELIFE